MAGGLIQVGLAGSGSLRWAAVDLTAVVEEARSRLDLSPVAAAALGRGLGGAALLLRLASKTATRVVLEIRGDGPIRSVLAEADADGNLRGTVGRRRVALPPTGQGKLAVGRAVGRGFLRVLREHEGGSYQSQVELVSGEIGEDLAHYLAQSEQTRSAVLLGVLAKPHGVAGAGGMILEVLPEAPEEAVTAVERSLQGLEGVSRILEEGGVPAVVASLLGDLAPQVLESQEVRYRCRCNRERLRRHLVLLSADELEPLRLQDGAVEAECAFCAATYRFDREELRAPAEDDRRPGPPPSRR